MIDHVALEVTDLERSAAFYDAIFYALGARRVFAGGDWIAYGTVGRPFWIKRVEETSPGGGHVALKAVGKRAVDAAWEVGVANGGTDDGAPGPRHYGPSYYAAYLLDPDGHRVEVVTGST
jgi:catechol 2,3-dioxygenase-like lactoylglutathione lyase family enzyme